MFKNRYMILVLILLVLDCSLLAVPAAGVGRDDPEPPDLDVSPLSIEAEIEIPESSEHELRIENTGRNALSFSIVHQIVEPDDRARLRAPRRDDSGEIVARFAWNEAPMNRYKHAAYDWVNEWMCL
ncbi:MAG: hypothetical protein HQ568_06495, partial [Calditrichaeota bacterium]|nr:hypothetical protein [Calditrichota bacterium]